MAQLKTYTRPMAGWWRRNPFYLWYMVREASCVFITIYALVLLVGLWRLSQGQAAFDAWRAALTTPISVVFHLMALVLVIYHSWTWFKIMPKTMPFIRIGGRRIADRTIITSGVIATIVASLVLFVAVRWAVV
ncbi:MAG: fumarate reductase [Candidatus Muproteobacteria bacterium RBG_16_60_9]|uniref:Fumarate reductase n=1 Tax=Candidatus Muproteobacteria bacterium RBG_16_60_9 TaxID=1817755 RepID=A0A1F6UWK9_9PROT|nr:MAG: fumarate reductase [Candidatus Muproteobacteria bacterium RBG_16_60_9]